MTKRTRTVIWSSAATATAVIAFALITSNQEPSIETAGDPCAIWGDRIANDDVSTYTIGEKQESVTVQIGYPEGTMAREYMDSVKDQSAFARDGIHTPEEAKAADLYWQEKGEMGCLTDDELDTNIGEDVTTYPATPPPGGVPRPEGVKTSVPDSSVDAVADSGMVDG